MAAIRKVPPQAHVYIFGHQMIALWIGIWRLGIFGSWSLSGKSRSTILHSYHQEQTCPAVLPLLWRAETFWNHGNQDEPSLPQVISVMSLNRRDIRVTTHCGNLIFFLFIFIFLPFAFCFSNSIISACLFSSSLVLPYAPNLFWIFLETFVLATVLFCYIISFWLLLKFVCYIYVLFIYHFLDFLHRVYQFCGHLRQTF